MNQIRKLLEKQETEKEEKQEAPAKIQFEQSRNFHDLLQESNRLLFDAMTRRPFFLNERILKRRTWKIT